MASEEIICITGGIGSGKSIVSRVLRQWGFRVYDCDSEAKRIMDTSVEILHLLKDHFGDRVIAEGKINRAELGKIVFRDDGARKWINELVHEEVIKDILINARKSTSIFFVETAIPTTAAFSTFCHRFWLVECPDEIRIERVMARNGLTQEEVRNRINSQAKEFISLPAEKTIRIPNDGETPLLSKICSLTARYFLYKDKMAQ